MVYEAKWFTPKVAVIWLSMCNMINYLDRGIISGAGTSIKGCLETSDHCSAFKVKNCTSGSHHHKDQQCTHCPVCSSCNLNQTGFGINTQELGYLQSSFMVGYAGAGLLFANMVHKVQPFRLIGIALSLWVIAVVMCGLSGFYCKRSESKLCDMYYMLLFGRMLSGVGEAAIAAIAVPYIDDRVSPERKGIALATYFTAIPVGTALGFIWGGKITEIFAGKWEWAFFIEAPFMVPFAISAFFIPHRLKKHKKSAMDAVAINSSEASPRDPVDVDETETKPLLPSDPDKNDENSDGLTEKSFWSHLYGCITKPVYLTMVFGYAAYTAVLSGLAFYVPLFIQKNRPCDSAWDYTQSQADFVTGAIVAGAGFVGTLIGGHMVDRAANEKDTRRTKLVYLNRQLVAQIIVSTGVALLAVVTVKPVGLFLVLGIACVLLFTSTAGINLVINWSVPTESRAMGIAVSNVCIHAFGDVPSPVAIGALDDITTPKLTMFFTLLWLCWTVVLWIACWFLSWRLPK
eukprot:m.70417 g.70417  ORF g.70417 m.70417 type:complete len:516 (-) comp12130_c0_seq1:54-1601(-)